MVYRKLFIYLLILLFLSCKTSYKKNFHNVVSDSKNIILPVATGQVTREQLLNFKKQIEDSCKCKPF